MTFRFADAIGRYRLVVSDELLAFIERAFVAPAPEQEQAGVRAEAHAEAAAAELEICSDGTLISRVGTQVLYRARLPQVPEAVEAIGFDKAPGQHVTLRMMDASTIAACQPGKPITTFVRVC